MIVVQRLTELIVSRAGIDSAHMVPVTADNSQRICIQYDPTTVSTGEVRELAKRAGVELDLG